MMGCMLESWKMIRKMDKVSLYMQVDQIIKEIFKMVWEMVKVFTYTPMEINMKVIGKIMKKRDMVNLLGKMAKCTKEIFKMVWSMAMVSI